MDGSISNPDEAFAGGFMSHFNGKGEFQFRTIKGRVCTGEMPLPFQGRTTTRGPITCSDGLTGTIEVTMDGLNGGNGTGQIAGRPFAFVFVLRGGGV
jgi:hypothetical protein